MMLHVKEVIETTRLRLQTISPDAKRSMAARSLFDATVKSS